MGLWDVLFAKKPLEKAAKQGNTPPAPTGSQDNTFIKGAIDRKMNPSAAPAPKAAPAPPPPKKGLAKAYRDAR